MKNQYVKQLLTMSTIYFAASVAMAADATATGTASGAVSTASGGTSASSESAVTGAFSRHESAAEMAAANRLASEFETLAGSRENAMSLVKGLRNGTSVPLTLSGQSGASGRLVFSPPTQPMGYGEVSRALSLTRDKLAAQGISYPTPEQLHTVLMGGATVSGAAGTAGVLQLRSQGMGWKQIAQNLDVNLKGNDLVTDTQASPRSLAVTGGGSANANGEGVGVKSRTQIDAGVRTGVLQGSGGIGIGGGVSAGGGLGLGR